MRSKKTEITSKLRIDRFFENAREKYNIYAFQNESKLKAEFLENLKVPILITLEPKRKFFLDDYTLIEKGFVIYFKNFTDELYNEIKKDIIENFKATFFVKVVREDTRKRQDKTTFDGKFYFKNFERGGKKEC